MVEEVQGIWLSTSMLYQIIKKRANENSFCISDRCTNSKVIKAKNTLSLIVVLVLVNAEAIQHDSHRHSSSPPGDGVLQRPAPRRHGGLRGQGHSGLHRNDASYSAASYDNEGIAQAFDGSLKVFWCSTRRYYNGLFYNNNSPVGVLFLYVFLHGLYDGLHSDRCCHSLQNNQGFIQLNFDRVDVVAIGIQYSLETFWMSFIIETNLLVVCSTYLQQQSRKHFFAAIFILHKEIQ